MAHVVFSPAPRCRKAAADYITATIGEQLDEAIEDTCRTEFWRSTAARPSMLLAMKSLSHAPKSSLLPGFLLSRLN
jgi:hypothetical protein